MNNLQLNQNQQEAVDWNDGPMLVLAGPGSGKTTVLTQRIIRLLSETPDERFRILALTFTQNAAHHMREKIDVQVTESRERVYLTTFHSFCADVIRQHGELEGIKADFIIMTNDADREDMLLEIIHEAIAKGFDLKKEDVRFLNQITSALEHCVPINNEDEPVPNGDVGKASYLFYHYVLKMKETARIDYAGMLYFAWILLGKKQIAKHYSIVYKYICVDEYQDTNLVQYNILTRVLKNENPNLFIVADDDQIIYQWNGASPERLTEITEKYNMQILQLPENYRCPSAVVDIANKMIVNNKNRYTAKRPGISTAATVSNDSVDVKEFDTFTDEIGWIVSDIKEKKRTPLDTKIMGRTRKLLEDAQRVLNSHGINTVIHQRKTEFESPSMRFLHSLLRFFSARADKLQLQRLLAAFYQIEGINIDYHSVIGESSFTNGDLFKAWQRTLYKHDRISNDTKKYISQLDNDSFFVDYAPLLNTTFDWLDTFEGTETLPDGAYSNYLVEKDIFGALKSEIDAENTEGLPLSAFLQELDLRDKSEPVPDNAFELITIHAAKGLEFEHVYLIGMVNDILPTYNSIKNGARPESLEEERRSCYVAITRTQKTLIMTYAARYNNWNKHPSIFLQEMGLIPTDDEEFF